MDEAHEPPGATELARAFVDALPHCRATGMKVVETGPAEAVGMIPYSEDLVGDPETGVVHGGVITTLLDNISGLAAVLAMEQPQQIATLDLRIDYNRPATPGRTVYAHAHCHKVTRAIAFVRGIAYEESREDPVATSVGTFMVTGQPGMITSGRP